MRRDAKNYTTEELVFMFNSINLYNEEDINWMNEMYSELTLHGFDSSGNKIQYSQC